VRNFYVYKTALALLSSPVFYLTVLVIVGVAALFNVL